MLSVKHNNFNKKMAQSLLVNITLIVLQGPLICTEVNVEPVLFSWMFEEGA